MPIPLTEDSRSVPNSVARAASRLGAAVIVNDYWLARRQRVHFAWIPETNDTFSEHELTEVIQWLQDQGIDKVILVPGVRRRPQPYFLLTLEALTAS